MTGSAPLVIGDSKVVYRSGKGIESLERGVLAFLSAGPRPGAIRSRQPAAGDDGFPSDIDLARSLDDGLDIEGLPWYAGPPGSLPLAASPGDLRAAAARLSDAMAAAGIAAFSIRSRVVTARDLNGMMGSGLNKADALARVVAGLLAGVRAASSNAAKPPIVRALVDRLGGRKDYAALLGEAFPDAEVVEDLRAERESRYAILNSGGRGADGFRVSRAAEGAPCETGNALRRGAHSVTFACEAESRCLTVALASMVSKYVRELFMRRLNRFFAAGLPGIRPTAGYPVDAGRFLAQTAAFRERAGIDDGLLVRAR